MKVLIFNDSEQIQIQSAEVEGSALRVRMINVTPEDIRTMFLDKIKTKKMQVWENGKVLNSYENYTVYSYIKESAGKIYEVEMIQDGLDPETRIANVEKLAKEANTNAIEGKSEIQMAIAELTMLIASMGGDTNV